MRNPVGASHPTAEPTTAEPTTGPATEPLAQNHLPAALRDYAEDLLSGTGIDLETILGLPLTGPYTASPTGPQPPQKLDGDLAPALWAGWSAAVRHASPTGPTQLTLPDPSTAPSATSTTATDGDDQ